MGRFNRTVTIVVAALMIPTALIAQRYDLLITGGRVMDGTGNPWRYADVALRGDRIVAVGNLSDASADRVIDARGKVVAPGFIDIHSHADGTNYGSRGLRSTDRKRRAAPNLVTQGITTVVVNQDGRSPPSIADQTAELERLGIGLNAVLLVGHGAVRRQVLGEDHERASAPAEIQRMRDLVRQAMLDGAWGMSAGLEYVPGRWSTTDEVVAMVEEIVPFGGVYISHERSEGADPMWYWPSQYAGRPPSLIDAVRETIEIGERTGATVVASHIKAKGANYWGTSAVVIRLIEEARQRGVSVYADQYPYNTTGSDGSTVLIPRWIVTSEQVGDDRDFSASLRTVLADDSLATLLRADIAHEIQRRGGPENILVMEYRRRGAVGKSLAELATARDITPVDMAIVLQLEGDRRQPGGGALRGFSLSEHDIEPYAAQEWTATATDGWVSLPEDGLTHARVYGTFPRKIRRYALERGVLSVEAAVRSASSLPAAIIGFADRGLVHEGYMADVVVFDLNEVRDNATFFEPHQYSSGIEYVIVGGKFAVDQGKPTGELIGRVLTRDEAAKAATGG